MLEQGELGLPWAHDQDLLGTGQRLDDRMVEMLVFRRMAAAH
jgi:hypothetical protein